MKLSIHSFTMVLIVIALGLNGHIAIADEKASIKPSPITTESAQKEKVAPKANNQKSPPPKNPNAQSVPSTNPGKSEKPKEERDRNRENSTHSPSSNGVDLIAGIPSILMVLFTGALALMAYRQYLVLQKQIDINREQNEILNKQTDYNRELNNIQKVIERAYVKMSHHPPGLDLLMDGRWKVRLRIENLGRTPARITSVMIGGKIYSWEDPLPKTPDYSVAKERPGKAFLVPNDFVETTMEEKLESPDMVKDVQALQKKLLIIAYVDYIDQFGKRHRGGYGRLYSWPHDNPEHYEHPEHFATRSNLVFLDEPGYNYDRERQPGEGTDWDDV